MRTIVIISKAEDLPSGRERRTAATETDKGGSDDDLGSANVSDSTMDTAVSRVPVHRFHGPPSPRNELMTLTLNPNPQLNIPTFPLGLGLEL